MKRFADQLSKIPAPLLIAFQLAYLYFAGQLLLSAWVTEDAYITFRALDNWVNGFGLRWNVAERVQAHTNPLWLFVHAPFYWVWPNIYIITLALSAVFSIASVWLAIRMLGYKPAAIIFLLVALAASKSWREYAISGLENPLTFFFAGLFLLIFLRETSKRGLLYLSLITALAAINRLDMLVFFAPFWLWIFWGFYKQKTLPLKPLLLGALPLIGWLAFSFLYYGFFFPNTKYAKLNTGISTLDYTVQGLWYGLDFIYNDLVGFFLIIAAAFLGNLTLRRWHNADDKHKKLAISACAMLLYCAYTIVIGGDFMTGRFFSLPIYIAAIIVAHKIVGCSPRTIALLLGAFVLIAAIQPGLNREYWRPCNKIKCFPHGIADERFFFKRNWLINRKDYSLRSEPEFIWARWGRELSQQPPGKPYINAAIGLIGYYGGPGVHQIDVMALADPLLARLPVEQGKLIRVGHYRREIPRGYEYALQVGDLSYMDPNLAQYYEKLRTVITADVWDMERIKTAIRFNLGEYDHFKEEYLKGLSNNQPLQ